MNDNFRYIVAGLLIFFIILLQPSYLRWLGYGESEKVASKDSSKKEEPSLEENDFDPPDPLPSSVFTDNVDDTFVTISTPLYVATISNRSGGSFYKYILNKKEGEKYKYLGGHDSEGVFDESAPVSLILSSAENYCNPCMGIYDIDSDKYSYFNSPFKLKTFVGDSDTIFIDSEENVSLEFVLYDINKNLLLSKRLTFFGDTYITDHVFLINNEFFSSESNFEIIWSGGLRPTELVEYEDVQYGSVIVGQGKSVENIQTTNPNKDISRSIYNGQTDWVSIRTKYFLSSLISNQPGLFATASSLNYPFGLRENTPQYSVSIGYPYHNSSALELKLYLGPLDVDYIKDTKTNLDAVMNWGWAPIRPISKGILWVLKFMHNTFHLNYGFVLLLFALLVRLVTGPLTKKSYESTQKMQKIQPQIKKIQEKFKKDPQRLNREMMGMYKKHGVNPLGGCLPMLLQMPLLMALFIVFRTTIELRGQPFLFWITDLSKPDTIFTLPFSLPIYGDGVAILPLLMGVTLFLTMRMSSATMDKNQKPIMYFMNGFFILLFNTFPSGLNLYYTTYNIMSFLQQRTIKKQLSS